MERFELVGIWHGRFVEANLPLVERRSPGGDIGRTRHPEAGSCAGGRRANDT